MDAEKTGVDGMGASMGECRLSGEKTSACSVSKSLRMRSLRMKGWASRASIPLLPDAG
jgi:hypothetical protein